jgi:hypothetical protein
MNITDCVNRAFQISLICENPEMFVCRQLKKLNVSFRCVVTALNPVYIQRFIVIVIIVDIFVISSSFRVSLVKLVE